MFTYTHTYIQRKKTSRARMKATFIHTYMLTYTHTYIHTEEKDKKSKKEGWLGGWFNSGTQASEKSEIGEKKVLKKSQDFFGGAKGVCVCVCVCVCVLNVYMCVCVCVCMYVLYVRRCMCKYQSGTQASENSEIGEKKVLKKSQDFFGGAKGVCVCVY